MLLSFLIKKNLYLLYCGQHKAIFLGDIVSTTSLLLALVVLTFQVETLTWSLDDDLVIPMSDPTPTLSIDIPISWSPILTSNIPNNGGKVFAGGCPY